MFHWLDCPCQGHFMLSSCGLLFIFVWFSLFQLVFSVLFISLSSKLIIPFSAVYPILGCFELIYPFCCPVVLLLRHFPRSLISPLTCVISLSHLWALVLFIFLLHCLGAWSICENSLCIPKYWFSSRTEFLSVEHLPWRLFFFCCCPVFCWGLCVPPHPSRAWTPSPQPSTVLFALT